MSNIELTANIYSSKKEIVQNISDRLKDWNLKSPKGQNWYLDAMKDLFNLQSLIIELSNKEVSFEAIAAITSILSPANRWEQNLKDSYNLLYEFYVDSNHIASFSTYGANVSKARNYLTDFESIGYFETKTKLREKYFKTNKTRDFFYCLLNPQGNTFVIDRHMVTISIGSYKGKFPTKKQYSFLVECYKEAADNYGINYSYTELQAQLWCAYQFYDRKVVHYK